MSQDKTAKFELLPAADAATEKQLEVHKKNIRLYATGVFRSGAQMVGYAYLAGREINQAAALLPHGQLLPWIKECYSDFSESATRNWRDLSVKLDAKFATVANLKGPIAGLLNSPNKPKKTFTEKECIAISAAVREAMDGKGMMEFLRDAKLLAEVQEQGGFHPSAEKVTAFIETLDEKTRATLKPDKSQKSEGQGGSRSEIKFEDLPPKLQLQFKKSLAAQSLKNKPSRQDKVAADLLRNLNNQIVLANKNKWLMRAFANPACADDCAAFLLNIDKLQAAAHDYDKAAKRRESKQS